MSDVAPGRAAAEPPDFNIFRSSQVGKVLLGVFSRWAWSTFRVRILERSAELETSLSLTLAVHYGREPEHVLSLHEAVLWRVPIDVRIKLLDEALWRSGLHDEVPFLVSRLGFVFRVRNLMAHSISYGSGQGEDVLLTSVRNGKIKSEVLSAEALAWAVEAAEYCKLDLMRIEGRIGDIKTWAAMYGFAER